MGYRVGYQCFNDKETAHDYLLSQQLPLITADGQLIRPIKQGQNWYLNGTQIQLSFPECDIATQIGYGGLLIAPFIGLAIIVFGIKQIISLMKSLSQIGDTNHD